MQPVDSEDPYMGRFTRFTRFTSITLDAVRVFKPNVGFDVSFSVGSSYVDWDLWCTHVGSAGVKRVKPLNATVQRVLILCAGDYNE